jgi:hypothetical protein
MLDMQIEPTEYERLRSWLHYMVPKVFPAELLNAETDPVVVLDRMASKSPGRARQGLRMAIGDVVEITGGWSAAELEHCDSELSGKGLPTLTDVRACFSKAVRRVVRRGRIRSEEEFYALRNAVDQQGINADALAPLLEAYEVERGT